MGFFSRKKNAAKQALQEKGMFNPDPGADERYPGSAGYSGYGLKKNAMPENRFKFVPPRPDDRK